MISSRVPFLISLSIHLTAGVVIWVALRNSVPNLTADVETASSIGSMNWEVEATPQPKILAHKKIISASQSTSPAESHVSASPDSAQVQSYLSMIRSHLADAIHIHEPRGAAATTLVLKIKIQRSGKLETQEIEKTSGSASIDQGVLQALDSILPLPAFPAEWEKAGIAPERMTVRVPVEIRQNP